MCVCVLERERGRDHLRVRFHGLDCFGEEVGECNLRVICQSWVDLSLQLLQLLLTLCVMCERDRESKRTSSPFSSLPHTFLASSVLVWLIQT